MCGLFAIDVRCCIVCGLFRVDVFACVRLFMRLPVLFVCYCVMVYGLYCVLCLFPEFALMRACFVYCVCFACDAMFDVVCHVLFVLCRCVCATCLKRCLRVLFLSDRVMFCGAFAMCGLLCVMCC